MAWRNIWRNPRRTLITISSILFAVLFSISLDALERGSWDNMINNVVRMYVGYIQVHKTGYWEEKTIDNAMTWELREDSLLSEIPQIEAVVPRLESFAVAAYGTMTRGVLLIGIDPRSEHAMTGLGDRLVEGSLFDVQEKAVVLGRDLAGNLRLETGDTLVLISQGYHGVNSAGKYPVKGIFAFPSPELNKQVVYLPMPEAQWFYGTGQQFTSMVLHPANTRHLPRLVAEVHMRLGPDYEVMTWQELIPELLKSREMDVGGNYIIYFILYLIISFGIFGTILMMVRERMYEFGILLSVGTQRIRLALMVWVESLILVITGAIAGIACSIPLILYLRYHPIRFSGDMAGALEKFGFEPIFPAGLYPESMLQHATLVTIIATILSLYAVYKIFRLKPVEAIRQG